MIDNIVVDVFKIICCSEPTDSFMVNVTVAQLPGHNRDTMFYSRGTCPGCLPPPGAATAVWLVTEAFVTKWNQRIPKIRRWQFMWIA